LSFIACLHAVFSLSFSLVVTFLPCLTYRYLEDLPAEALLVFLFFAASFRFRFTLGFSKNSPWRISDKMPACCTLLLKRFNRLSKFSLLPAVTPVT
jgi:hypothetical protein